MIILPDGFDFMLLIHDYAMCVTPFIVPALIASTFVLLVGVIKNAKRV